jgi:hypothetical protein
VDMPHSVIYNAKEGFIETRAFGRLDFEEARQMIIDIGVSAKENNCYLCLSDYRQAKLALSTVEIYNVPQILVKTITSLGLTAQKFKRAIIVKDGLDDFSFLETVTVNSGQIARLFQGMEEAKLWLLEK